MPDIKLDAYDIKILAALQRDGRMTKLNLAKAIHLSPSPCWERLRRLEVNGLIRGYQAQIDIEQLARVSTLWVEVTLKSHHARDFDHFEKTLTTVPEVVECYAIGGGFDYLFKVVTSDIDCYQHLMDGLLAADIGIERYFTYIVTKTIKPFTGYPVLRLLAQEDKVAFEKR